MVDLNNIINELQKILPEVAIKDDAASLLHYGRDWIKDFEPRPSAIVFPETTEQVAAVVQLCNAHMFALVPSGGRTGLSGGASATNGEIVISLEKMRAIHEVNCVDRTVTCQAGAITQTVIDAASQKGLYFPIQFTSIGSSQIGGNIATNAGGIRVVKYGNLREWVLGLTVVTGAGDIVRLNGFLEKNNTGYDLRSIIIGSEGTLGIITEAVLKLTDLPKGVVRCLCALSGLSPLLPLFELSRKSLPNLSAFELMDRFSVEEVRKARNVRDPFGEGYPWYVLLEVEIDKESDRDELTTVLGEWLEQDIVVNAVISESTQQADELMGLREAIGEVLGTHYTVHKNDISVPVRKVPEFLERLKARVQEVYPSFGVAIFGHVGDGNLHVNVIKPEGMTNADFWSECREADRQVFTIVKEFEGSISAEHGVGLLKKEFLSFSRSSAEIALMKGIKRTFDPKGILNPGKIFD